MLHVSFSAKESFNFQVQLSMSYISLASFLVAAHQMTFKKKKKSLSNLWIPKAWGGGSKNYLHSEWHLLNPGFAQCRSGVNRHIPTKKMKLDVDLMKIHVSANKKYEKFCCLFHAIFWQSHILPERLYHFHPKYTTLNFLGFNGNGVWSGLLNIWIVCIFGAFHISIFPNNLLASLWTEGGRNYWRLEWILECI